jgi:hypothetical protein
MIGVGRLDEDLGRILASAYLTGMESLTLEQIRSKRAECAAVEVALSYLRRLAQGRLDIVNAYLAQAEHGTTVDLSALVEDLPFIMAGPPRPSGPGRLPTLFVPEAEVDDLNGLIDDVCDARRLAELPSLDVEELRTIAQGLRDVEAELSSRRSELHHQMDALQAELVDRYKTGRATVEGLLS